MRVILLTLVASLIPLKASGEAILLGTAGLHAWTVDDLTVIQNEDGNVMEWLDLSVTAGLSVGDAVTTYRSLGFHWATDAEVAQLLSVFGINYYDTTDPPWSDGVTTFQILGAMPYQMDAFIAHLGVTGMHGHPFLRQVSSEGWVNDQTVADGLSTGVCLNTSDVCTTRGLKSHRAMTTTQHDTVGTFLVRVPEPATALLAGVGVIAIILRRRHA